MMDHGLQNMVADARQGGMAMASAYRDIMNSIPKKDENNKDDTNGIPRPRSLVFPQGGQTEFPQHRAGDWL